MFIEAFRPGSPNVSVSCLDLSVEYQGGGGRKTLPKYLMKHLKGLKRDLFCSKARKDYVYIFIFLNFDRRSYMKVGVSPSMGAAATSLKSVRSGNYIVMRLKRDLYLNSLCV